MKQVLITDTLFIDTDNELAISSAGFSIDRLNAVKATEEQLIDHIQGKSGYVLGGIETVTRSVIDAADQLEVISFTGSGYQEFVPAWQEARARGIKITTARGSNAQSVAEFTLTLAMMLLRRIPQLTPPSTETFAIAREVSALTVGIVGYGNVGKATADTFRQMGATVIVSTRADAAAETSLQTIPLPDLLHQADIVAVHVSKEHGHGVLGATELGLMKPGAVLINAAFPDAVDCPAMFEKIRVGALRAAFDAPPLLVPADLPVGAFVAMNSQTAFNTTESNKRISDRVTDALLAVLNGRTHPDIVV